MSKSANPPADRITMSVEELARLIGKGSRRVRQIDKELRAAGEDAEPLLVKAEDGKYDAAAFVQAWVKYRTSEEAGGDLNKVRAAHEELKMRMTELKVRQTEGELIRTTDVLRVWSDVAGAFKAKLLSLPTRMALRLTHQDDPEDVRAMLDGEIRNVIEELTAGENVGRMMKAMERDDGS